VRKMLMLVDREEISRGLAESMEYKEIGLRLGRDSSVISREVARHGGRERYRAAAAHEAACAGRECARTRSRSPDRARRRPHDGPRGGLGRRPINRTRPRSSWLRGLPRARVGVIADEGPTTAPR
jgi:helix-turn-helix protein